MPYQILFSPAAKLDLEEALQHYEAISLTLGERFTNHLDDRLELLSITPGAGAIRYEDVRCTFIEKFPYLIHYTVDNVQEAVTVLRIFHTSRKPLWEK